MMGAWKNAWTWRDKELFVIIEDDVEMSGWWFRATVNMWTRYGDRPYIAAVGLQNQEFTVHNKMFNISGRVRSVDNIFNNLIPVGVPPFI